MTFIRVQKNIFGGFLYSNWGGESKKLSNRPAMNLTFKIKTTQQCKLVPGQEAFIYLFIYFIILHAPIRSQTVPNENGGKKMGKFK